MKLGLCEPITTRLHAARYNTTASNTDFLAGLVEDTKTFTKEKKVKFQKETEEASAIRKQNT